MVLEFSYTLELSGKLLLVLESKLTKSDSVKGAPGISGVLFRAHQVTLMGSQG
jgi:D-serine dehydratase